MTALKSSGHFQKPFDDPSLWPLISNLVHVTTGSWEAILMSPESAILVLNKDPHLNPITLEACETIASLDYEYAVELRISASHWARISQWERSEKRLDPSLMEDDQPEASWV